MRRPAPAPGPIAYRCGLFRRRSAPPDGRPRFNRTNRRCAGHDVPPRVAGTELALRRVTGAGADAYVPRVREPVAVPHPVDAAAGTTRKTTTMRAFDDPPANPPPVPPPSCRWSWPEALAAIAGSVFIAAAVIYGAWWTFTPGHGSRVTPQRPVVVTEHGRGRTSTVYKHDPAQPPVTETVPGPARTVYATTTRTIPAPGPTATVTVTATPPAPQPTGSTP